MIRARVLTHGIKAGVVQQGVSAKPETEFARVIEIRYPLDMGITGASAGNIVRIKTTDGDGRPTELEALDPTAILGISGIEVVGEGNAVTEISVDPVTKTATFTLGEVYMTHDDVAAAIEDALACGTF